MHQARRLLSLSVPLLVSVVLVTTTALPTSAQGPGPSAGVGTAPVPVSLDPVVTRDVPFATVTAYDGTPTTLTLDLYRPFDPPATPRPVVLWLHGGGFWGGDKSNPMDVAVASDFARDGYVVASANYRVRPITDWASGVAAVRDAQFDAQTAVQWLRANAASWAIDPSRVIAMGWSAGAVTSLHVAYREFGEGGALSGQSSSVSAVVLFSGFGLVPTDASTKPTVPVLMINGATDGLVPLDTAVDTCQAVVRAGKPCEQASYPTGHGLDGYVDPARHLALEFLARHGLTPT